MKYKTLRTYKLQDAANLDSIHSILHIKSHYGDSLAIAFKGNVSAGRLARYGESQDGCVVFIPLSCYTYHFPYYIALPKEFYSYIRIKMMQDEEGRTFMKAVITKPVTW